MDDFMIKFFLQQLEKYDLEKGKNMDKQKKKDQDTVNQPLKANEHLDEEVAKNIAAQMAQIGSKYNHLRITQKLPLK